MVSSSRRHESGAGATTPGTDTGYDYPKDEFDVDDWGGPVGAHRASRKGWMVALPWLVGAAVILLLTGIALSLGLGRDDDANVAAVSPSTATTTAGAGAAGASASGTTTAGAAAAGSASATRSASTPTTGAATSTASSSASSSSASAAAGQVNRQTRMQILNSTRRNGLAHRLQRTMNGNGWNVVAVDTYRKQTLPSVVYYRSAADQATAAAVGKLYGIGTKQSTAWNTPITLMIGNDFPS